MRRSGHLLVAALAALVLSAAASTTSANHLSISSQGFRLIWTPLTIAGQAESGFRVECNATLEGSFHRPTTEKFAGNLLGYIVRPSLESCVGGTATFLAETLPWHITYGAFTGSLPNITGVIADFSGVSVGASELGVPCLMRTEAAQPVSATAIRGESSTVTGVRLDETDLIPATGNFICRTLRMHLSGTGRFLTATGLAFRYILI